MDSLTQFVLGAAVAAAVVPAAQRRRALVYGAALGTLPDLDVLISYGDPVADFTLHRSFSHSLLVLALLAPLLYAIAARFDHALREAPRAWPAAFAAALLTHPLLDAMTIYGTQLLWPLDRTPYGVGSVFIIDPLYTLPLLLAAGIACWRPLARFSQLWLRGALLVSSAYLGWSVLAQQWVLQQARSELARQGSAPAQILALPGPFNTLLWRVLVREPGGYREAYFSLLADDVPGPWRQFRSLDELQPVLAEHPAFVRLQHFTHGYYSLRVQGESLVVSDLRMGSEPAYVFAFALARQQAADWQPHPAVQLPTQRPVGAALAWLRMRLTTPGAQLPPPDLVLAQER